MGIASLKVYIYNAIIMSDGATIEPEINSPESGIKVISPDHLAKAQEVANRAKMFAGSNSLLVQKGDKVTNSEASAGMSLFQQILSSAKWENGSEFSSGYLVSENVPSAEDSNKWYRLAIRGQNPDPQYTNWSIHEGQGRLKNTATPIGLVTIRGEYMDLTIGKATESLVGKSTTYKLLEPKIPAPVPSL